MTRGLLDIIVTIQEELQVEVSRCIDETTNNTVPYARRLFVLGGGVQSVFCQERSGRFCACKQCFKYLH